MRVNATQHARACYDNLRYIVITGTLTMLRQYLPILIFLGAGPVLGRRCSPSVGLLGPRRPDAEKLSPYECGFEAFEDSRMKFDVRYYLVAIIFIVFDLEIAFLFPWAVSLGVDRPLRPGRDG